MLKDTDTIGVVLPCRAPRVVGAQVTAALHLVHVQEAVANQQPVATEQLVAVRAARRMRVAVALTLINTSLCVQLALASEWILHALTMKVATIAVGKVPEVLLVVSNNQCVKRLLTRVRGQTKELASGITMVAPFLPGHLGTRFILRIDTVIQVLLFLGVGLVAVVACGLAVVVVPASRVGLDFAVGALGQ